MRKKITINYVKAEYLDHIKKLNYSEMSIKVYDRSIDKLIEYLSLIKRKDRMNINEISKNIIQQYYEYLLDYKTIYKKKLKKWSLLCYINGLRGFFKYAVKQGYILFDPMTEISLKRPDEELHNKIIRPNELRKLFSVIEDQTVLGLRDRMIFEVLYSTGIRRGELLNLDIYDIDIESGYLRVNMGKGKKDRVVPIGERACKWVKKYIRYGRPVLLKDPTDKKLLISRFGRHMGMENLQSLIYKNMKKARLNYSAHNFRHSFATEILKGGADIRHVQLMLGHAHISSTEIYTKVVVEDLRETLSKYHPRGENFNRNRKSN